MSFGLIHHTPELSHMETTSGFPSYQTTAGITGLAFHVPMVDLEQNDSGERFLQFNELIKAIDPRCKATFQLSVSELKDLQKYSHLSRRSSQNQLPTIDKGLRVFLEWRTHGLIKKNKFFPETTAGQILRLGGTSLQQSEIKTLFDTHSEPQTDDAAIDFGSKVIGVIRLKKGGTNVLDWSTLAGVQDQIPYPYELTCSIRRLPQAKMDYWLRAKLNRDRFAIDPTTGEKVKATSDTIRNLALHGSHIFDFEWLLTLKRSSDSKLREDLAVAAEATGRLGDSYIETIGALPSYLATLPGSDIHVAQKEIDPTILYFLPITCFGSDGRTKEFQTTSCVLHRKDGSAHLLDIFDRRFLAFNTIITGKTGSGKSVFGNILSRALLNDPLLHLVKVDVGGSYKRECNLYHGKEFGFHLDRPSGVDPFASVTDTPTNEVRSVLTELLATLALDEEERTLSKSIRSDFEKALKNYFFNLKTKTNRRSFHDFIETSKDLPRREILSRFAEGGVFENAIHKPTDEPIESRYIYFNFENLNGASNQDYASGVMAAVTAEVNLQMIRLSAPEARSAGKRLVFFCEETKFFIERNSVFFLLTTANSRKFGHAVILTGQNIEDFILKKEAASDNGLLLNCPIKVFFETQARVEFLQAEFGLSRDHCNFLKYNSQRTKDYRQFILQDDLGTRACRLYLTRREYWEVTSSRSDVDRLDDLQRALPWMSEDQRMTVVLMQEARQDGTI